MSGGLLFLDTVYISVNYARTTVIVILLQNDTSHCYLEHSSSEIKHAS